MKDKPLFWQGTKGRPQSLSYLGEVGGRNILYIEGGLASKDDATRIRDTWNACLGLDLPEDVPPGILKDLADVAKGLLAQAVHYGPTNPAELGGSHACDLNDKARAILAKLSGK